MYIKRSIHFQSTIATSQVFERRTVHILFILIGLSFSLYLFGMLSTVSSALHRRTIEASIRDLVSQTASLEGQYLALTQNLTLESEPSLGLSIPRTVAYAHESSAPAVALLNGR
jgi:hypothetical protein